MVAYVPLLREPQACSLQGSLTTGDRQHIHLAYFCSWILLCILTGCQVANDLTMIT